MKGQKIQDNGAEVQVFEYPDEATRNAESDLISPNGTNIVTTMITRIGQPGAAGFWSLPAIFPPKRYTYIVDLSC